MDRKYARLSIACLCLLAGTAIAQPRLISLGSSVPSAVNADGSIVTGSGGGSAARWLVSGNTVTLQAMTGSTSASHASDDGLFAAGVVVNTANLGGLGATATMAARWNAGTWSNLGLLLPDAGLGVTGPGTSSGSVGTPRAISANGRFVVGQTYIAPNNSFRFRGFVWDSEANGGAGEMRVLPTSFNTTANRYRDGRALAVSNDGRVIVGGEDPNTSGGRVLVYRFNDVTGVYDMDYLPDGIMNGNPITRTVDNFFINPAGDLITGTSPEFDADLGFTSNWIAQWTWNGSSWDRHLLYSMGTAPGSISSWWTAPACPPSGGTPTPNMIITSASDDGSIVAGILVYSTCGSFVRGGFVYDRDTNTMSDLYDALVAAGTTGINDLAPPSAQTPPRLGWPMDISPDGMHLVGYGGPQTSGGPGWIVSLGGGDCVPPFVTVNPADQLISRCRSFIMNAAAGGSLSLTYQWHKDGQPIFDGPTGTGSTIVGAITSQLRVNSANPNDVGSYVCVITGPCGSPVSTTTALATLDPAVTAVANDTCATALTVGEGTFNFNPCGAFYDDLDNAAVCSPNSTADVWFEYVPTFTGDARIETCPSTYNTVLTAFDTCFGNTLECNDDYFTGPSLNCASNRSRIARLPVTAGVPVLIRVASAFAPSGTPSGALTIGPAPAAAPNDDCFNAIEAVEGENPFDTTEARFTASASCNTAQSRDVWFTYTSSGYGRMTVKTCPGTTWSTVVSVSAGCGASDIACNNNANQPGCTTQSIVSGIELTPSTTYYIRVGSSSATTFGAGVLTIEVACFADFNQDGGVDGSDVEAFFTAWEAGSGSADVNFDGGVDGADVETFFLLWEAGGCD
ncbi:MAG: hypothetical protein KF859_01350 [Phycisphaeraceae bacterium]|nr:hypothetical protein [Phycisphaeraceae bacterium]